MAKKKEFLVGVSYKPKLREEFNAQDDAMDKFAEMHHGDIDGAGYGDYRDYFVYFKSIHSAHNFIRKIKKVYKRRVKTYTNVIE